MNTMDLTQFIPMLAQIKYYSWRLTNYYDATVIHPLAGTILLGAVIAIFTVPRRFVIPAAILVLIYTSSAQRLVVFGVDFNFARILCVVGLLRVAARGELSSIRWSIPDTLVIVYSLMRVMGVILRGQDMKLMAETGWAFDQIAAYLIGRSVLREPKDWGPTLRFACVIIIPVALFFLREKLTGRNAFHVFGGVPEMTLLRHGKLRAQGAFPHPIIAGALFVTLLPLMMSQWKADLRKSRGMMVSIVGSICCLVIVFSANSSTPFGGLLAVLIGWALFPLRASLPKLAWCFLGLALVLHFISENGIFHLMFARFSFVSGSTGYHRYVLYDAWMRMVPEWFAIGSNSTAHWGRRLFDVTSEYVGASVRGGIIGFVAFVSILVYSFKSIAKSSRLFRATPDEYFVFALGVSLFAHIVMFLGVQYFGAAVFWFWMSVGSMISIGYGMQHRMATIPQRKSRRPVNRDSRNPRANQPLRGRPFTGPSGQGI